MQIPQDVVRMRLVFDLGGTTGVVEEAVMGFHCIRSHFTGNTVDWPGDTQQAAEKLRDKWIANVATSRFPNEVKLNRAEAYHLNTAGRTLDKGVAPTVNESGKLWNGSSGSAALPFEVACAVSLYGFAPGSFTQGAARKRGRFFLPPLSVSAMGSGAAAGRFSSTAMDGLNTDMGLFLNDIHRMVIGGDAGVGTSDNLSLGILSTTGGIFTRAVNYRVGDVPDSQRRRRRQMAESYRTGVITDS